MLDDLFISQDIHHGNGTQQEFYNDPEVSLKLSSKLTPPHYDLCLNIHVDTLIMSNTIATR